MSLIARISALTHRGMVRDHNEDVVLVRSWIENGTMEQPYEAIEALDDPLVLLVCDGMGGQAAGAEASHIAAKGLAKRLIGNPGEEVLARAVRDANDLVFDAAQDDPAKQAMGSTIAGLWLSEQESYWFNVGDSSIFRFANGFALKLSLDDVRPGPRTGTLTQSLGGLVTRADVEPHLGEEQPRDGWTYLICSDGLTDMVDLSEIEHHLQGEPPNAARNLLKAALAAGGDDNISLIIVRIGAN